MNSYLKQAGIILIITLLIGVGMGAGFMKAIGVRKEGFVSGSSSKCKLCGNSSPCGCRGAGTGAGAFVLGSTTASGSPDMSKYVLKTTIPPCPQCPDMSEYMLKSECPPVPDLSKYVLKSSIPKPQPVIIDSSACKKECGECPPCPRPRCPDVKCPPPTKCPPPAPCPRPVCPPTQVKCKAEEAPSSSVRPYLAPLSVPGYGMA
jgi:hypothetical protein